MHIYFSGIGGTGIGPLALIANKAGYDVSGSDKQNSAYIEQLKNNGIDSIQIGQSYETIAKIHKANPIDWFVHTSALTMENKDAPELAFCHEHNIRISKRDELLNQIIADKQLKLIAIAGTHGKTTTTAMTIWLFKQLGIPVSYSLGAKISFGDMGEFDDKSEYFVYEADEFDRNFLQFKPHLSIIPGIAYDHPDIFPTQDDYNQAFIDFLNNSDQAVMWERDKNKLKSELSTELNLNSSSMDVSKIKLPGLVNRENAYAVATSAVALKLCTFEEAYQILSNFPGVSRRFEIISKNVYSDYAHTPEKIEGALQLAHEVAGDNVVVVYEGLHNTRQHFVKDQLRDLFKDAKKLYIVPSYLAREDEDLELLTPEKLSLIIQKPELRIPSRLDDDLKNAIKHEVIAGNLVLCLTAGGGGSLDEWLRRNFH